MKYCEHCGQKFLDEAIMCPACGKFVEKRQKVVHDNGEQTKPKTKKYDMLGVLSVIFIAIRYVLYAVVIVLFWFVVVVVGAGVGATTARISEVSLGFFLWLVIPLVYLIPSFIVLFIKVSKKQKIYTAFKIFILVACSVFSGVFLLCRNESDFENEEEKIT